MRFSSRDEFYVVTNAKPESSLGDVCFRTNLEGLVNQFRGGLTFEDNPTIFSEKEEAEQEAHARLAAMKAMKAMLASGAAVPLKNAKVIKVLGADNKVILEATL